MLRAWLLGVAELCQLITDIKTIYSYIILIVCINYENIFVFAEISPTFTVRYDLPINWKSGIFSHVSGVATGRNRIAPTNH